MAAEQRGAQQQRDHAAHRGGAAAAAAGVAWRKAVSARRAAEALTPAPSCLPAGPTPDARAQSRGALHSLPLAGLGAWRAGVRAAVLC